MTVVAYEDDTLDSENVTVDDVTICYTQKGDCTEGQENVQTIVFSTRNSGVARFINLNTDNWSVDDAQSMTVLFEDFKQRAGL